jgi:hypothetical protein
MNEGSVGLFGGRVDVQNLPRRAGFLAILSLTLMGSPALAKKEREAGPPAAQQPGNGPSVSIVFTAVERRLIADYYADPQHAGPVSDRRLPPGIAKKVARGGALPPGIAKRYLPDDLEGRLRPMPQGVTRVVIGSDVLLVEAATGLIYDVIKSVVRGR